eukprot:6810634-Prymnesium_polylepis.1
MPRRRRPPRLPRLPQPLSQPPRRRRRLGPPRRAGIAPQRSIPPPSLRDAVMAHANPAVQGEPTQSSWGRHPRSQWPLARLVLADAELDDVALERAADSLRRAACVLAHLDLRLNGGLRPEARMAIRLAWRDANRPSAALLLEDA